MERNPDVYKLMLQWFIAQKTKNTTTIVFAEYCFNHWGEIKIFAEYCFNHWRVIKIFFKTKTSISYQNVTYMKLISLKKSSVSWTRHCGVCFQSIQATHDRKRSSTQQCDRLYFSFTVLSKVTWSENFEAIIFNLLETSNLCMYISKVHVLCSGRSQCWALRDSVEESNSWTVPFLFQQMKGAVGWCCSYDSCRPHVDNECLSYDPSYFKELIDPYGILMDLESKKTLLQWVSAVYFFYVWVFFFSFVCVCVCTVYMPVSAEARGAQNPSERNYGHL